MVNFIKKEFHDLSNEELYAILKLRMEIFMLEQHSFYLDLDDQDQQATHIFGIHSNMNQPICYGRISVENKIASIRRVCVHKEFRQRGLGSLLMNELLVYADTLKIHAIELDAQIHLQAFYGRYDFYTIGQPYDDGGIIHVLMQKIIHK